MLNFCYSQSNTIKCTTSKLQTKIIEGSYGDELTGTVTLTIWPNIQSAETAETNNLQSNFTETAINGVGAIIPTPTIPTPTIPTKFLSPNNPDNSNPDFNPNSNNIEK